MVKKNYYALPLDFLFALNVWNLVKILTGGVTPHPIQVQFLTTKKMQFFIAHVNSNLEKKLGPQAGSPCLLASVIFFSHNLAVFKVQKS